MTLSGNLQCTIANSIALLADIVLVRWSIVPFEGFIQFPPPLFLFYFIDVSPLVCLRSENADLVVPGLSLGGRICLYNPRNIPSGGACPQPELRALPMGIGGYAYGTRNCVNPLLAFNNRAECLLYR